MTATLALVREQQSNDFVAEKQVLGEVSYMTLKGTLSTDFVGKKVAKGLRTRNVVINMRDVKRFASWGMSEWMTFLRDHADKDIYLVECSSYALSQLNLITGLLGHAKLVSYYSSFRCSACGSEMESRFLVPKDRDLIRTLPQSQHTCVTCGGVVKLEEYPASFFDAIADRVEFDIADEVLAFLRTKLGYDIQADVSRFRAYRTARNGFSYIRLSGSMATLPAETIATSADGATVVDMEGIVFTPHAPEVAAFREFTSQAMKKVSSLQLLAVPFGFLETAVRPEDFKDKLRIRTFLLQYDCAQCERSSVHSIDVADNLEHLAEGTAPTMKCPTCRGMLIPTLRMQQQAFLRTLPVRDRDAALDKFVAGARALGQEKLENCLAPAPAKAGGKTGTGPSKTVYIALGLGGALVAGVGVVGYLLWKDHNKPPQVLVAQPGSDTPQPPPPPQFQRPEWILGTTPSSAYCHDMMNRLMCVGISAYVHSVDEGQTQASVAALEELSNTIGLKIDDPYFKEHVLARYSDARGKALSALQAAEQGKDASPEAASAFAEAQATVEYGRARVVSVLRASGGAALPAQYTDWHWEEYAPQEEGAPRDTLVFVRYDLSTDAIRSLIDTYAKSATVRDATAMTAFPSLGWALPKLTAGAMLTKVGSKLKADGVAADQFVTAVGDQAVTDVAQLKRRVDEAAGDVALKVTTGTDEPKLVTFKR